MLKRRNNLELIYLILRNCQNPCSKTDIAYGAKMNFQQLEKYLRQLYRNDLISINIVDKRKIYEITEKGKEAMKNMEKVIRHLNRRDTVL